MDRRTHAKQLADELGVTLRTGREWIDSPLFDRAPMLFAHLISSGASTYCSDTREIFVREINSDDVYWTTLHELGHAAFGHVGERAFTPRVTAELLAKEVAAWEWALEHSLFPPTPRVVASVSRKLGSYIKEADFGVSTAEAVGFLHRLERATYAHAA